MGFLRPCHARSDDSVFRGRVVTKFPQHIRNSDLYIGVPQRPCSDEHHNEFRRACHNARSGNYYFRPLLLHLRYRPSAISSHTFSLRHRPRYLQQCYGAQVRPSIRVVHLAYSRSCFTLCRGFLPDLNASAMDAVYFEPAAAGICFRGHEKQHLWWYHFGNCTSLGWMSCCAVCAACVLVFYADIPACCEHRAHCPLQCRKRELKRFYNL